jgi:hypothetical protein
MRYLRAIVESESQKQLFKKDFQAQKIFMVLTRLWANSLISADLLRNEEIYNAFVVPHYGQFQHIYPSVNISSHIYENTPQIILDYQELLQPDVPINFFSVGVWVSRFPAPYWANFRTSDIPYFWKNLEEALIRAHIATPTTKFQHKLYARDDQQVNFLQEELAPSVHQQDHASLVEITPIEDVSSN